MDERDRNRVYRCPSGHVHFGNDFVDGTCLSCESAALVEVTEPEELMALAESHSAPRHNREAAHRFADAALCARMRELDPAFAARYERIQERGFWYA